MRLILFICLIYLPSFSFSQFKIGLCGAPQLTYLLNSLPFFSHPGSEFLLPTLRWNAGGLFTYDFYGKNSGLQLGILYSKNEQKFLYKYTIQGEHYSHKGRKRFTYIQVPLVYRISGYVGKFTKLIFFIGPQFSYLLNYGGGLVIYDPDKYFDLPPISGSDYKKYSIDAILGWSFEYAIKRDFDVFASLKLLYGMNNIENTSRSYNGYAVFPKGGAHQVSLGLLVGGSYIFHRKDNLILPTNLWRYRKYKKKIKH
jgi:hypothetical protein